MAGQSLAFGYGAYDRPQPRIMGVRHRWKQMMFDLMVKTAGQPGRNAGAGGKVGRGADLVHGPIVTW